MKLRQNFLKRRSFNHFYGQDILTSFLFGRMEKQSWKSLWGNLINFCRTLNLQVGHRKKRVAFLDANASHENGSISTDLHTKSTDSHQYVPSYTII